MPLSRTQLHDLRQAGCSNIGVLYTNETREVYTADTSRPEVIGVPRTQNKYVVSNKLRNILSPTELSAFTEYGIDQMEKGNFSWYAAALAAVVGGGAAAYGMLEVTDNPEVTRRAKQKRDAADRLDGKKSNPSGFTRRELGTMTAAVIAATASGGLAKQALDNNHKEDEKKQIAFSPALASAICKIDAWNRGHLPPETQPPQDSQWRDSYTSPTDYNGLPPRGR